MVIYVLRYLYIMGYMALSLKDPEAHRLAREIADRTGETLTGAIVVALRERLARLARPKPARRAGCLSEEPRENRAAVRGPADAGRSAARMRSSATTPNGLPR